jgi:hypothetical protein
MFVVSVVCLSGRGLCDGLITRPEESYRLCCVIVFDLETSKTEENETRKWGVKASKRRRRRRNLFLIIRLFWSVDRRKVLQSIKR